MVNLSEDATTLDGIHGHVLIGTDRARDGERVDGTLALEPWDGVVVALALVASLSGTDRPEDQIAAANVALEDQ